MSDYAEIPYVFHEVNLQNQSLIGLIKIINDLDPNAFHTLRGTLLAFSHEGHFLAQYNKTLQSANWTERGVSP